MDVGNFNVNVNYQSADKAADAVEKIGAAAEKSTPKVKKLGDQVGGLEGNSGKVDGLSGSVLNLGGSADGATTGVGRLAGTVGAVTGAAAAAGAAIGAAVVAINEITTQALDAADANDELAQKLGLTNEALGAMKLIADENGTSVESLQKTYDKLSKSMQKADEDNHKTEASFKILGITQKDLATLTQQEIAGKAVQAWELLGRGTKETVAIMNLLGPAFREQIPAIKAAAEQYQDYYDRALKYGSVATPQLIQYAGDQEKASKNLEMAWQGLANQTALQTAGMKKTVTDWATESIAALTRFLNKLNEAQEAVRSIEAIPQARRNELLSQAKRESDAAGDGTGGDVNRRFKALLAAEASLANEADRELARFKNRADAVTADNLRKEGANVSFDKPKGQSDKRLSDADIYMKQQQAIEEFQKEQNAIYEYNNKVRLEKEKAFADAEVAINKQMFDDIERAEQEYYEKGQAAFKKSQEERTKQYESMQKVGEFAFQSLSNVIMEFATTGEFSFKKFLATFLKGIAQMIVQITILTPIMEAFKKSFATTGTGGGWGTLWTNILSAFAGARADGGPVSAGKTYLVGGRGPELFRPHSTGTIVPNHKLAAGGGQPITIHMGDVIVQGGQTNAETGLVVTSMQVKALRQLIRSEIGTQKGHRGLLAERGV